MDRLTGEVNPHSENFVSIRLGCYGSTKESIRFLVSSFGKERDIRNDISSFRTKEVIEA